LTIAASARQCSYAGCETPLETATQFYEIRKGSTAGSQDWSALAGRVLCSACYRRFMRNGGLEHSKAARADPKPLGQVEARGGGRAGKRGASFEGQHGDGALKTNDTASASPETALVCFF
jgi:hypothetical protein